MEAKYNHLLVEKGKNKKWIDKKYFQTRDANKEPYSIIIPLPNVTGKLHIGHAWNGFIQDTLIRYKKMNGYDVKWVAAMDHAGIATQAKVEELLFKNEGLTRLELGRDKFVKKIWEWKEKFASLIEKQWGTLGFALDYSDKKFTLDPNLSKSVNKIFINLYNRGLIYKANKPINWDPKLKTVVSNIEVENKETAQIMYYIDYDLVKGGKVTIATVRTETLYSDSALAVNPKDKRFNKLIGQVAIHPLTGKNIPIIEDENIEIDKGTGVMKVSAHAEMDYKMLKDNNLPIVETIDKAGKMVDSISEFAGLDRFKARELIAQKLKKMGKISKEEKTMSAVGFSSRSGEVIEVISMPQWFVKMDHFKKIVLDDLKKNNINIFPTRFGETLTRWIKDSYDWCVSRQLWWGHRIPAWYKGKDIKVQIESPGKDWIQDEDVLDTWFSSGIAPFTFLGWPDQTQNLNKFYPTSVLVTAYDIIFFWVARMYFQSLDIMKEKPFNDLLIHGLIRDEKGRKMSKSLGNGIDPMDAVQQFGADSLRWFMLTNSSPGLDIRYSEEKISAAWGLNNKLWNISRYIIDVMDNSNESISEADKWINNKLFELKEVVDSRMAKYEFTLIGKEIHSFIEESLSSWYIEISKARPNRKFALDILEKLLIIIHPFLPFITDHIFSILNKEILEQQYPIIKKIDSKNDIQRSIDLIKLLRAYRYERNISNKVELEVWFDFQLSDYEKPFVKKIARVSYVKNNDAIIPYKNNKIFIKMNEDDRDSEQSRRRKEINRLNFEISRSNSILENKGFIAKAPIKKINEEKRKLKQYKNELQIILKEKFK